MRTEDAWTAFDQINQWIRFADAKASVLLASSCVVGGILLSRSPSPDLDILTRTRGVLWGVGMIAVALSALFSLLALQPRLRIKRSEPNSLLYFDHVARRYKSDPTAYLAVFNEAAAD